MSQEINQRILDALNEGYNPQDILSAFSMSKDPEHQSWYENYTQSMRDRARETNMIDQRSIPGKPGLGVMERVKKHVEETSGEQLAGEAALAAGGLYAGKRLLQKAFPTPGEQGLAEQNKIARERLELQKSPVLSPLEEARLETEKAKAEYQRKRIEMLDRQMAKAEAGKQLSPADQSLLNLYEQQRAAKQATAQAEINKQMGFAPPGAPTVQPPVVGGQPPAPPASAGVVPPQNRIPGMMAAQEMSNPLGGLASAYTEPLRPPPTVAEMGQQSGGVISEAAKAPAEAIPPAEKNKGGRPKGVKTATAEERAAKEAAKGINMYRNMFGFEAKDPTSAKSLAAIEATNRLIAEGYEGKIPASRDPLLNPSTDVGASGKKFYSGTPEGYRNVYIPWLEKNLNTLPPETQAHVLESMTKGQTKDIGKIIKGLGLAGAALGAYDTAFAKTPGQRGMAGANVLGAVLPPGADITEAGAPVLPPNILAAQQRQLEEMQKLGSPYRKR